ncbi:hypothetical protein [Rhizobium sp.]
MTVVKTMLIRVGRCRLAAMAVAGLVTMNGEPVHADNKMLVPGYPGCITEDLLSQFTNASVTNDERGMSHLETQGCFRSVKSLPYSMVDYGFAVSEIRVYLDDGEAVRLFVPTEATR